jgi:hypothetical protein
LLSRPEFERRAEQIRDWFVPLNPYQKPGSVLKREDVNDTIDESGPEPLYCFAISAERYALFNRDADGTIVLRKPSAHGLGHLIDPYDESDAPEHLPRPRVPLSKLGVRRWQHDVWIAIIQAAVHGHPDIVNLDWHPAFRRPAASRYGATSPHMLSWVDPWNIDKPYDEQIRPFGFLISYTPRQTPSERESTTDYPRRGRPRKARVPKPIAPFDGRSIKSPANVFDRVTGETIHPDQLKTYAEVLAQYHLSPESKFENGRFRDRGRTERRHVVATGYVLIGKEANQVGETGEADPIVDATQVFADSPAAPR